MDRPAPTAPRSPRPPRQGGQPRPAARRPQATAPAVADPRAIAVAAADPAPEMAPEMARPAPAVAMPGPLRLGAVPLGELALALRGGLAAGRPLVVDAAAAAGVDAATAQLLIAANRAARAAGSGLVIRDPAPAFVAGFEALGLFPALMAIAMETSA